MRTELPFRLVRSSKGIAFLILLALAGFGSNGLSQCENLLPDVSTNTLTASIRKDIFVSGWKAIRDLYVSPDYGGLDWSEVRRSMEPLIENSKSDQEFYALMKRMARILNDDHTRFIPGNAIVRTQSAASGVSGFGLTFLRRNNRSVVSRVFAMSPASRAGIRRGDEIVSINGQSCFEAEDLYQPPGAKIRIVIRTGTGAIIEKVLISRPLSEPEELKTVCFHSGGVVYVYIPTFAQPGIASQIESSIEPMLKTCGTLSGLIIDLRGNSGGRADELSKALGHFIEGKIGTDRGKIFQKDVLIKANTLYPKLRDTPMAILVDAATSSASEIFAASLQFNGRASIVGERTRGNTEGTLPFGFSDGSILHIAVIDFFLPDGRKLSDQGVIPDIELLHPWGPIDIMSDPVIEKALQLLLSGNKRSGTGLP